MTIDRLRRISAPATSDPATSAVVEAAPRRDDRLLLTAGSATLAVVLVGLIVADILHVADPSGAFGSELWNGDRDGSLSELVGHVALLSATALLVGGWRMTRQPLYAVWAIALVVIVADDFLMLHEKAGRVLLRLPLPARVGPLRIEDVGELAFWAVAVAGLAILMIRAMRAASARARADHRALLVLVALLALFAGGIDVLHVVVDGFLSATGLRVMTLMETGGELGMMFALLVYSAVIALRARLPLSEPLRLKGPCVETSQAGHRG